MVHQGTAPLIKAVLTEKWLRHDATLTTKITLLFCLGEISQKVSSSLHARGVCLAESRSYPPNGCKQVQAEHILGATVGNDTGCNLECVYTLPVKRFPTFILHTYIHF